MYYFPVGSFRSALHSIHGLLRTLKKTLKANTDFGSPHLFRETHLLISDKQELNSNQMHCRQTERMQCHQDSNIQHVSCLQKQLRDQGKRRVLVDFNFFSHPPNKIIFLLEFWSKYIQDVCPFLFQFQGSYWEKNMLIIYTFSPIISFFINLRFL